MKDYERMHEIIGHLEQRFPDMQDRRSRDPFSVLIATILSQNTSDRNSHRAFTRLNDELPVTPESLANTSPDRIRPAIEIAGLSATRSRRIVEVSKAILHRYGGDLTMILTRPMNEARKELMSMEGVGPKTADVVLLFAGNKEVMPVDTNIFRVVDRISFAKGRNYERTRGALEALIPGEKRMIMHLLLIRLGREICRPTRPRCPECPINQFCEHGLKLLEKNTSQEVEQ
jgi:endonuclease-3